MTEFARKIQRGADAVVDALVANDVELVVGFIGHTSHEIADALSQRNEIRSFHPVTEFGGAQIVTGYNMAKGRGAAVGIWHTVGSLVAAAGVFEANECRVQALHIGFNVDGALKGRDAFQDTPNERVFPGLCRHFSRVERPDKIPEAIHHALRAIGGPRGGAAFLDIPFDLGIDKAHMPEAVRRPVVRPSAVHSDDVWQIVGMLKAAKRPFILAGGGVVAAGATGQLQRLAELVGAPVSTTLTAMGALPHSHPLSVGPSGVIGWPVAHELARDADLFIAIGCRLADWGYAQAWAERPPANLVHIDSDPTQLGQIYTPTLAIAADVGNALDQIVAGVRQDGTIGPHADYLARVAKGKAAWLEDLGSRWRDDQFPLSPWRVVHELQNALGSDGVIVTDVGNNAAWVFQGMLFERTRHLIAPFGAGVLGSALPLALGAKLAKPESPVAVVTGDGGFQYTLNEIATAVRENIPVVILVLNDGLLGASDGYMRYLYGHAQWVELHNPDFTMLAKAYGAGGERIESVDQLAPAIARGVASNGVYVIDLPVSRTFTHPTTGVGPTVRWEAREWPSDVTGMHMPGDPAGK